MPRDGPGPVIGCLSQCDRQEEERDQTTPVFPIACIAVIIGLSPALPLLLILMPPEQHPTAHVSGAGPQWVPRKSPACFGERGFLAKVSTNGCQKVILPPIAILGSC